MLYFKSMLYLATDMVVTPLQNDLRRFLEASLHTAVDLAPWRQVAQLPAVLTKDYTFQEAEFFGANCVFMLVHNEGGLRPMALSKQAQRIASLADGQVVVVVRKLSPYQREQLIASATAFIVPGVQLYLPRSGMELRVHARRRRTAAAQPSGTTALSPSAQALFIAAILRPGKSRFQPYALGEELGYTRMTIGRAYQSLVDAQLFSPEKEGTSLWLNFADKKRAVWQRALILLQSPVRTATVVHGSDAFFQTLPLAGESALSEYSMLGAPVQNIYALGPDDLTRKGGELLPGGTKKKLTFKLLTAALDETMPRHGQPYTLQSWTYSARLGGKNDVVDRLSLWLSMKDRADERIALSLDEMLENVAWE
jgi:hypothetical protein